MIKANQIRSCTLRESVLVVWSRMTDLSLFYTVPILTQYQSRQIKTCWTLFPTKFSIKTFNHLLLVLHILASCSAVVFPSWQRPLWLLSLLNTDCISGKQHATQTSMQLITIDYAAVPTPTRAGIHLNSLMHSASACQWKIPLQIPHTAKRYTRIQREHQLTSYQHSMAHNNTMKLEPEHLNLNHKSIALPPTSVAHYQFDKQMSKARSITAKNSNINI